MYDFIDSFHDVDPYFIKIFQFANSFMLFSIITMYAIVDNAI